MTRRIILIAIICALILPVVSCGHAKNVEGLEYLRCDGVYQQTDGREYLRFFEDGSATRMSSDKLPEEIYDNMDYENVNSGLVGKSSKTTIYDGVTVTKEIDGDEVIEEGPDIILEFKIGRSNADTNKVFLVTYKGFVEEDTLKITGHSTLNGATWEASYKFVKI